MLEGQEKRSITSLYTFVGRTPTHSAWLRASYSSPARSHVVVCFTRGKAEEVAGRDGESGGGVVVVE